MFDFDFDKVQHLFTPQQRRSLRGMMRSLSFDGRLAAAKCFINRDLARWDDDDDGCVLVNT